VAPAGVLVLRVMATRYELAVAVCESDAAWPQTLSRKRSPGPTTAPLAPSSAPDEMAAPEASSRHPQPIRPLRQLVNVRRPARPDTRSTADAASAASPAPSGRPFHARGSLLSGARKAYRTSLPLSRVMNERLVGATPAPPPRGGLQRGRLASSLKGLRKHTTQRILCQVECLES
jgi:hypothetical protein